MTNIESVEEYSEDSERNYYYKVVFGHRGRFSILFEMSDYYLQ